jgi:hypothetical protein
MAVVNTKSQVITDLDASPVVKVNPVRQNGRVRESMGYLTVTSGDSIASTYRYVRIPSRARVTSVLVDTTAITTCAGDLGLYRTAADGGAVVSVAFFGSAISLATAVARQDNTYESGTITIPNRHKRLWEQLGLTTDPRVDYDVAITLTAAAGSAGDIAVRVQYIADE